MSQLNAYLESAAAAKIWSDEALLAAMLRFELELTQTQVLAGLVPQTHGQVIAAVVREEFSQASDLQGLAKHIGLEARKASTLAIPLVNELRSQVAMRDAKAAKSVHLSATSQDVVDTAMMLQAKASLGWMLGQLDVLGDTLALLVEQHRHTPMMGRTLLQQAQPISVGYKLAVWLSGVTRARAALARQRCYIQWGGAVGGLQGSVMTTDMIAALAKSLDLSAPSITWHSQRDELARLGNELAVLAGVLGKLGLDTALAMQNEVAEMSEPLESGRGVSSAMPHKRNPVGAMHMVQAAQRAPHIAAMLMQQQLAEHERGLSSWQPQIFELRDLFLLVGGSLEAAVEVVKGLEIHAENMAAHLATHLATHAVGQAASHADAAQAMQDEVIAQWRSKESASA